jgi:hypothetical protein
VPSPVVDTVRQAIDSADGDKAPLLQPLISGGGWALPIVLAVAPL